MGILDATHPDVEPFVTAKEGTDAFRNFNPLGGDGRDVFGRPTTRASRTISSTRGRTRVVGQAADPTMSST